MAVRRCKICSTVLDFGEGYEVKEKGLSKWYCSKEEYDEYMSNLSHSSQEQEEKKQQESTLIKSITNEICIIINELEINSPMFLKELDGWAQITDKSTILEYLSQNESELIQIVDHIPSTSTQYTKIKYLSAVISNNISQFISDRKAVELRKQEFEKAIAASKEKNDFVFHENDKCRKKRRKGFAELESAKENLDEL